jgi:hypothetical protein
LGLAYFVAVFWLSAGWPLVLARFPKREYWLDLLTYFLVAGVAVIAYFAAIRSGAAVASADLVEATSRLPRIETATDTNEKKLPLDGYRVLLLGTDSITVFKPTDQAAQLPFIHVLKRDDIRQLILVR